MSRLVLAGFLAVLLASPAARAAGPGWTEAARWSAQREPKAGPARAIGSPSAGCLQGAAALPTAGEGYELLHPERHLNYGHPSLVEYLFRLAGTARSRGLPALVVGDVSQPRGGPAPINHASHQTGLDVDLAYTRPADALWRPLEAPERQDYVAVVHADGKTLTGEWHPRIAALLGLAASDSAVDRIFVSPVVKRELCGRERAPGLARLRPWRGHREHFHVRLRCPADSPHCVPQPPVPPGDGCGAELAWWFTDEARIPPRPGAPGPSLPPQCAAVLK